MKKFLKTRVPHLQLDLFGRSNLSISSPQNQHTKKTEKNPSLNIRFIDCSGIQIKYELRRSKRRTIGFLINENGLRVTAPLKTSLKTIEEAIKKKEDWIKTKLHYFLTQYKKPSSLSLKNGVTIPYLGNNFSLRIQKSSSNNISLNQQALEIIISTINIESEPLTKRLLTKWFQEKAKEYFAKRLPFFSTQLNVKYHQFSLSSAKSRWGSCSTSGNIRLNWRLIHFSPILIDYVIVHELAHLREMNHSNRFWNIVSEIYPHYKTIRKELNLQGKTLSFW